MERLQISSLVQLIVCLTLVLAQQRNPPGVNPSQYQQGQPQQFQQGHPPPPPQQQQFQQGQPQQFAGQPQVPQQQFQQVPQQQFQQAPQQQFQQHVPQQQFQQGPPPPQHGQQQPAGHAPHAPHQQGGQKKVLHKDMQHEKEHMKEHMDVPIDTSNMSEQELQFHYFKMHDSDGNNKLDGCELVKSLIHWHDQANHDHKSGQPLPEEKIFKDDELVSMIDPILETDDKNNDGYIDYSEFVIAQQAAQAAQAQAKQ